MNSPQLPAHGLVPAGPAATAWSGRGRHRAPGPARRSKRARLGVTTALLAVISTGGIALAYWSASGLGVGTATTGTASAVSLSPGAPADTLFPGGRADVALTVSNPNRTVVIIASIALDTTQGTGGFAVDADHSACAVSALSLTPQTNAGEGWSVPAKTGPVNGTLAISLSDALSMDAGAANACQGARFTVYLVAGS